ncbi:hypothetical protein, partial [Burkholderia cenocepacia]|uniref:hypothetical protein n=1 Tax=Burkholderia cenocepacia TaxID=95486 RepID=UPI00222F89A9
CFTRNDSTLESESQPASHTEFRIPPRNARFRQASQRNAVIPCRQAALEIVRLVDILRKYPTETPQRASTLAPP